MADFEDWAVLALDRAFAQWESGDLENFSHHIEMAFSLFERQAKLDRENLLYCPFCEADTPSTRGAMWIRCHRCDRMHMEKWHGDEDVIW